MKIKTKIIVMLMIIFIIVFGYTILSKAAWDEHDVDYYRNADDSYGQTAVKELAEGELKFTSKAEAEKYIECYDALLQESSYGHNNNFYIMEQCTDNTAHANDIIDGRVEPDKPNNSDNADNPDNSDNSDTSEGIIGWPNYENKIADASTDEEWRAIYDAFADPSPGTGEGEMTDYFAEKYIKLVGQILESGSFQIWADFNEKNARSTLEGNMEELVKNGYNIQDEEAQEILKKYGADVDENGMPIEADSPIYQYPQKTSKNDGSEESLEDLIQDGDAFLSKGETNRVDQTALQNFSKTMYNILLAIGVVVAVIVGALIGIKLMASSVDEQAEAKKLVIPYIVGCFILFGGFGIWKIIINILQGI